ncbi:hypothetical protein ACPPVV_08685 [Rhodanobacter sp. Col0626]|uniref:hypothetical protein n=1 Tax=Rhodanobacter sp. Col0626 TaxID=3415679 RepID=UPI003CE6B33E
MLEVTSSRRQAIPSLRSLIDAAYLADPLDQLIAPVGEWSYSTTFNLIPAALAVLREAASIEPDPPTLMAWYRQTPIAELGHLTAEQLVALSRTEVVIVFLRSVRNGARD